MAKRKQTRRKKAVQTKTFMRRRKGNRFVKMEVPPYQGVALRTGLICGDDRKGKPCEARPMGNGKCAVHGGKVKRGSEHPNYKGAGYSQHLPTRMQERFEESASGPGNDRRNLDQDLDLIYTRITELFERIDIAVSETFVDEVGTIAGRLDIALQGGNPNKVAELMAQLLAMVADTRQDFLVWGEIVSLLEQRRKTMDSIGRLEERAGRMVHVSRVLILTGAIGLIIKEEVTGEAFARYVFEHVETRGKVTIAAARFAAQRIRSTIGRRLEALLTDDTETDSRATGVRQLGA